MSGKLDGRSYAWTLKNFQSTHIGYRAHRAVIFAIAGLSCYYRNNLCNVYCKTTFIIFSHIISYHINQTLNGRTVSKLEETSLS